jgi:hypothetical protein
MSQSRSERRIAELEAEVRKLRHLLTRQLGGGDTLWMESGVNEHGKAFVHIHWGQESGQLTPAEAREHAVAMLEVAAATEHDAALWHVLREADFEPEIIAGLLGLMRERRGGTRDASAVAGEGAPEG